MTVRKIALLCILTAVAVVGKMLLTAVPNVQPATFLIILTGFVFGWKMGGTLGALVGIVGGIVSGLGVWTPFQVVGWSLIGIISGGLGKITKRTARHAVFILWIVVSAFLYGFINSFSLLFFVPFDAAVGMYLTGLPFDGYHAAGNLIFALTTPILLKVFLKQKKKFVAG